MYDCHLILKRSDRPGQTNPVATINDDFIILYLIPVVRQLLENINDYRRYVY